MSVFFYPASLTNQSLPGFVYPAVLHLLQEGCQLRQGATHLRGRQQRLLALEVKGPGKLTGQWRSRDPVNSRPGQCSGQERFGY